jgi:hypothetical protein
VNNSTGAIAELRTVAFARFEELEIITKTLGCFIDRVELVLARHFSFFLR